MDGQLYTQLHRTNCDNTTPKSAGIPWSFDLGSCWAALKGPACGSWKLHPTLEIERRVYHDLPLWNEVPAAEWQFTISVVKTPIVAIIVRQVFIKNQSSINHHWISFSINGWLVNKHHQTVIMINDSIYNLWASICNHRSIILDHHQQLSL